MKFLGLMVVIAMNPSFGYALSSLSCTDFKGAVKVREEVREDQYAKDFELEIKTLTMAGPQTLKFKRSELKITLNRDVVLSQNSRVVQNWKNQSEKYTSTEFAAKASFSRADGQPILQDDTPAGNAHVLKVNLICGARDSEIVK